MTKPIEHVPGDANAEQIEQILLEDGVVIIDQLNSEEFVERILDEISPWFDRAQTGEGDWVGFKTRRDVPHCLQRPAHQARCAYVRIYSLR